MKNIIVTQETIEQACLTLRAQMAGQFSTGADLTIKVPTKYKIAEEDMPTIIVSANAEYKMRALIRQSAEEVAWHGTVSFDEDNNEYLIEDIFVFPQDVTAATAVATDDYGTWLMTLSEEEFNKLRFHGHSHVNMGVTPSATDLNYQQQLLAMVNDFYIFAIYNKEDDLNIWIYNVATNTLYEQDDIYYDSTATQADGWAHNEIIAKVSKKTFAAAAKPKDWSSTYASGMHWDVKTGGYIPYTEAEKKSSSMTQDTETTKAKRGRPKSDKSYKELQKILAEEKRAAKKAANIKNQNNIAELEATWAKAYRYKIDDED